MKQARILIPLLIAFTCVFSSFTRAETRHVLAGDGASCILPAAVDPTSASADFAVDATPDLEQPPCVAGYEADQMDPPVSINLIPDMGSLTIAPDGGTFTFDIHVSSTSYRVLAAEYSTFVRLPSGSLFGPTSVENVTLIPFMNQTFHGLSQDVPRSAPAGLYQFIAQVRYGNRIAEDSFLFVKTGVPGLPRGYDLDAWKDSAASFKFNPMDNSPERPCSYALLGPYSSSADLATQFTVTLPRESDLTVSVYNTTGQLVTDLARGQYPAGELTLTFDAHRLAGGVYYVTAEVPGKLQATQKVMVR